MRQATGRLTAKKRPESTSSETSVNEDEKGLEEERPKAVRQDSVADSLFASAMVDFEQDGDGSVDTHKVDGDEDEEKMRDATPDVTAFQGYLEADEPPVRDPGKFFREVEKKKFQRINF
jgi:hypothetical protein